MKYFQAYTDPRNDTQFELRGCYDQAIEDLLDHFDIGSIVMYGTIDGPWYSREPAAGIAVIHI